MLPATHHKMTVQQLVVPELLVNPNLVVNPLGREPRLQLPLGDLGHLGLDEPEHTDREQAFRPDKRTGNERPLRPLTLLTRELLETTRASNWSACIWDRHRTSHLRQLLRYHE